MNKATSSGTNTSAFSASSMAAAMDEAHTRLCLVAVELIAEHFIRQAPEARDLIETLPPLRDRRLDSILGDIRKGAEHPADCGLEHSTYLAKLLVEARHIHDFGIRRDRITTYRHLHDEYTLINRLAAAWVDKNRDSFLEAHEALHRYINEADHPDDMELSRAQVADAPSVPEALFTHGPAPGGFGLLVGADGVGKGWLTLDLLLGCVLARPMNLCSFERAGEPLRALYLSYEDDARVLRWRLDRVCECAGVDSQAWRDAEHDGRLHFAADLEPLFLQGSHGVPAPTKTFHALAGTLKKQGADLCIIDPLAAAAVLQSENDNSALNAALRELARDTGCAILLTHHTSKASREDAGHHASRGGSALTGAARWVLRLIQNSGDRTRLIAGIPKNSYGRGLSGIVLQRLDQGVLREVTGAASSEDQDALADAVVRFVQENPDIEINPKAVPRNCSPGAKALIAHLGAAPRAVAEAVEQALKQERLQLEERRRSSNNTPYVILTPLPDDELPF